jgi:hypothetical protein
VIKSYTSVVTWENNAGPGALIMTWFRQQAGLRRFGQLRIDAPRFAI